MSPEKVTSLLPYGRAVVKQLPLILVLSFLGAAVAFAISSRWEPAYQVHFSYLVSLSQREASEDFRFDGYYALQATDLFSATLASWVQTPEIIVAAHEAAQLPLKTHDPRTITQIVSATKAAPQLVEVTVRDQSEDRARKLAEGLKSVMEREVTRYHEDGIPALAFRATPTPAWVGVPAVATPLIASVVFIVILVFSVNIVLLAKSFRDGE